MNFGKLKQMILAGLMMFSVAGSAIPVYAAQTVYDDYDESRLGSITLYKYVSNDGKSITSTGSSLVTNTDEQLGAIQQATGSYKMLPEQGVTFMYKHIGNYKQIQTSSEVKRYVVDLDNGFLDILNTYNITLNSTMADGVTAYLPDDVTTAMSKLCKATNDTATGEEAARQYVKLSGGDFNTSTNSYGKTVVENLQQGLYMVAEVDWEHQSISKHDTYWQRVGQTEDAGDGSEYADIVSPSSPFLVQIPINNVVEMTSNGKTYEAGEGWLYDVVAYPKNGSMTIHKDIIVNYDGDEKDNDGLDTSDTETLCDFAQTNYANSNENGEYEPGYDDDTNIDGDKTTFLTHQIDVSMGDTVRQVISSDVPALIGEKLNKTYKIADRMTKGLSFKQIDKVSLGTGVWNDENNTVLTENVDYTVNVEDSKFIFTVELTAEGLAKLDAIDSASYLYIEFDSTLNKDAMIGTDTYEYYTDVGDVVDATNQNTAMLTYATDRTGEHDYYSNTCKVYTYELDLVKYIKNIGEDQDYSNVAFTITGSTSKGTEDLKFVQEDAGVYHIYDGTYDLEGDAVETVYASSTGSLSIKGVDARDYVITEVGTVEGHQLLSAPINVRLEGHKQVDGYSRYYENGVLDHVYSWTGEEPLKLAKYDLAQNADSDVAIPLQSGRVKLTIYNSTYYMMRTGGLGNCWYYIVGGGVLALAVVMSVRNKRKERLQNEE